MNLHGLRPFRKDDPVLLIAQPAFLNVARDMVAALGSERAEIAPIEWKHFPDGTPNINVQASKIHGKDVILLANADHRDLLSFFGVIYAIPRYLARTFIVVTPFFPTGTMERVVVEGEIATAKTLTRMMDATPQPVVGQTTFLIYDIHALATRFFFGDGVKTAFVTAVPLLLSYVKDEMSPAQNGTGKPIVVVFPDEGAKKRFGPMLGKAFESVICSKTRIGNTRELTISEGDPQGRACLIVDDLMQSGGTLIECKNMLDKRGAASVSVYVTHGVFPNSSWTRFLPENIGGRPLHKFLVTDTIPQSADAVRGKAPFHVLGIGRQLAAMLMTQPDWSLGIQQLTKAKL